MATMDNKEPVPIPKEHHIRLFAELQLVVEANILRKSYTKEESMKEKARVLQILAEDFHNQFSVDEIEVTVLEYYRKVHKFADFNLTQVFIHGADELNLDFETNFLVREELAELRKVQKRGKRNTRNPNPILDSYRYETYQNESKSSRPRSTGIKKQVRDSLETKRPSPSRSRSSCKVVIPKKRPKSPPSNTSESRIPEDIEKDLEGGRSSLRDGTQGDQDNDPSYWRRKYEESQQRYKALADSKREIEGLEWKEGQTKAPSQFMEALAKKNQDIHKLREQIKRREYLRNPQFRYIEARHIEETYNEMKLVFDTLSTIKGLREFHSASLDHPTPDQEELFQAISGDALTLTGIKHLKALGKTSTGHIILSMTGAAICSWIFERRLESTLFDQNDLVDEYRKHIEALAGEEVLNNSDLAAYRNIVRSENFRENVIPRVVDSHVERLLKAMHPLIRSSGRNKTTEKLRGRIEGILNLAVRLKAMIMTTNFDDDCELIWPTHSEEFEANFMELGSPDVFGTGNEVILPLFPGMRVAMNDSTNHKTIVERSLMVGDRGTRKFSMVIKAVVLV